MTATIRSIMVNQETRVLAGDNLMILEAMKMEHIIVAPRDCVIAAVLCAEGESVSGGQTLIELEGEGDNE